MSDEITCIDATMPKRFVTFEIKISENTLPWLRNYLSSFYYHTMPEAEGEQGYHEATAEIHQIGHAMGEVKTQADEMPF